MDMINQLMISNQDANIKDLEILNLRSLNEQLRRELRHEKELMERINKASEVVKHFEELLRSPRTNDTFGLGYNKQVSSTKMGESSKSGKQRNAKGKPTCHQCGKLGYTKNICRNKKGMKKHKPIIGCSK